MFTKINNINIHFSFENGIWVKVDGPDLIYLIELREYPKGDDKSKHVEGYLISPREEKYYREFVYSQEFHGDFELSIYKMDFEHGLVKFFSHRFNDRDKIVEFILDTDDLKEAKLWAERVKSYSRLHGCRPVIKSKFPIINKSFPEYFKSDGLQRYKRYRIGRYPKSSNDFKTIQPQHEGLLWFTGWKLFWSYQHPRPWNKLNSQEIVDDILGL